MITVVNANALQIPLPDQSVQCIITSPPYWGLRDYGTATWKGGSAECDHIPDVNPRSDRPRNGLTGGLDYMVSKDPVYKDICAKCGARRIDAQIGLEPTPADYVANIVRVMREVWRVLRDDGTLWLNLGDSYFGDSPTRKSSAESFSETWDKSQTRSRGGNRRSAASIDGLKPKDLCGIPWRVAFALQDDGWYLRSDVIWSKPNPMPESVTDRPTKAHEYVFLLTKQARYYYDAEAIKESLSINTVEDRKHRSSGTIKGARKTDGKYIEDGHMRNDLGAPCGENGSSRNRRSVWTVATSPYSGAKETADYVGDDGKPYRASPNCPIHGHLARDRKSYTVGYDEPLDQNQIRNAGNGNDHEQAPVSLQSAMIYRSESDVLDENVQPRSLESIDDYRSEAHRLESILPAQTVDRTNRTSEYDAPSDRTSGLTRREYDPSATDHSKQKSKTARARRKAQRDNASSEIHGHTQSMLPIDEHIDLDDRTDENNSGEDYALGEMQIDLSVQKISRIARIDSSFDTSHMRLYCTCEVVSTDHFATFPPALVEPMILAGTSQRGACPTCGSGWVRVVEKSGERIVRYSATNNGPYRERNTVDELYTVGWQPACACYAVPPLPAEPDDKSNGHYAAYLAERARLLELYATLPTVPCRVLDPFAGTATVGRVCAKHGRHFIGTELNPKYITLADERTSKIQITMPL